MTGLGNIFRKKDQITSSGTEFYLAPREFLRDDACLDVGSGKWIHQAQSPGSPKKGKFYPKVSYTYLQKQFFKKKKAHLKESAYILN